MTPPCSWCCRARAGKGYWICGFNKRVLCQCGCHDLCTCDSIFQVIAGMFRALLSKAYPAVDHNGRPFAPGSRRSQFAGTPLRVGGACVAQCGDWQWFKSVLGLTGWRCDRGTRRLCWICRAAFTKDHNCFDFTTGAVWRGTMVTTQDFWASTTAGEHHASEI